jgi:hypothetical protein
MDLSSILLLGFVILLLSLLISFTVLQTVRPQVLESLTPKVGKLNSPTRIGYPGQPRDLFLVPAGATFSVYLFAAMNNKTPSLGNTQVPINLFQFGDVLKFQLVPGGIESAPKTQLVVQTQNPASPNSVETLDVAEFPQQTWVHLVLVREGRRYTVYYNGKVVTSARTLYVPAINSASLILGDKRLQGEFGLPKLAPTPYHLEEVVDELRASADTRHQPYLSDFWSTMNFSLVNFGCPNGLFCFSTEGPPKLDPMKRWTSPYA